ncbi:aldehyde dehydrogenase [Aureibacillus halotolerans]|nr:aldehyde dehydrogenase [Aureibacillus halotolerans]
MHSLIAQQKAYFRSCRTRSLDERKDSLKALKKAIIENEDAIMNALFADLHKSPSETFMTELGILYREIDYTLEHLKEWDKPVKVKGKTLLPGSKATIYREPYGTVLIIAPWNYPFQLAIAPLIGALASGNCAVIKPSEFAPQTSSVLKWLISKTFPESHVAVIEGRSETAEALLAEPFDYIFFTGSPSIGKKVMEAAAKRLTPHTLELGGKSPAIVHKDADLDKAAKRIAWGKLINAGQTCVAPDYALVHEDIFDTFLQKLKSAVNKQMKDTHKKGHEYPMLVHEHHFDRMVSFLNDGTIVHGGEHDRTKRYFAPTLLTDVSWESPVMQEEIFGPVLPIYSYSSFAEAKELVNNHPQPLAAYLFSGSKAIEQQFVNDIPFGGGCINDTIMHLSTPELPFGGIGPSGNGQYHGFASYDTFTHQKSIVKQSTSFDVPGRYHRGPALLKVLRKLF